MIKLFEDNYFLTSGKQLLKLSDGQTHGEWLKANMPDETRESLCGKGWYVVRTMKDKHVIQLSGMDFGKLRTINDIILQLPLKNTVVIQTALHTAYQISLREFCEIDDPAQLWAYKM